MHEARKLDWRDSREFLIKLPISYKDRQGLQVFLAASIAGLRARTCFLHDGGLGRIRTVIDFGAFKGRDAAARTPREAWALGQAEPRPNKSCGTNAGRGGKLFAAWLRLLKADRIILHGRVPKRKIKTLKHKSNYDSNFLWLRQLGISASIEL